MDSRERVTTIAMLVLSALVLALSVCTGYLRTQLLCAKQQRQTARDAAALHLSATMAAVRATEKASQEATDTRLLLGQLRDEMAAKERLIAIMLMERR